MQGFSYGWEKVEQILFTWIFAARMGGGGEDDGFITLVTYK